MSVEGTGVDRLGGLLGDDFRDPRMVVAQRVYAEAGDEVQVSSAGFIGDVAAVATGDSQRLAAGIRKEVCTHTSTLGSAV